MTEAAHFCSNLLLFVPKVQIVVLWASIASSVKGENDAVPAHLEGLREISWVTCDRIGVFKCPLELPHSLNDCEMEKGTHTKSRGKRV